MNAEPGRGNREPCRLVPVVIGMHGREQRRNETDGQETVERDRTEARDEAGRKCEDTEARCDK